MAEVQKDTIGSREDTLRFLDMVVLFGNQAMICLGKLANPMTGKAEWGMHSMQDDPQSSSWGGQNVFDVFTKSNGTALDGTKYSDW